MRTALMLMLSSLLLPGLTLEARQLADVRISNAHLQITCLDARPVEAGRRSWDLPQRAVSMTFTMRNRPRSGRPGADAGFASIDFTPQPGHVYEIEVRSDPMRYSERVWPKGEWRAVVRDRTTNQIISGEPQWSDSPPCGQERLPLHNAAVIESNNDCGQDSACRRQRDEPRHAVATARAPWLSSRHGGRRTAGRGDGADGGA